MKRLALPALLLAAVMLVSCDAGTTVIPGQTTDPTTNSPILAAPTTDESATFTTSTTFPAVTTAPVTHPVLYETPDITGTHDDVVPVVPIDSFIKTTDSIYYLSTISGNWMLEQKLEELDDCDYIVALVTPLEIKVDEVTARIAIDHVYVEHVVTESRQKYLTDETEVLLGGSSFMYGYGRFEDYTATQIYNEESVPITTTGGKYVMILELRVWEFYGEADDPNDLIDPFYVPFPLTWELDMANVPGSDGDSWNRPPYIGSAEDYYAFGFGDVWERYMEE